MEFDWGRNLGRDSVPTQSNMRARPRFCRCLQSDTSNYSIVELLSELFLLITEINYGSCVLSVFECQSVIASIYIYNRHNRYPFYTVISYPNSESSSVQTSMCLRRQSMRAPPPTLQPPKSLMVQKYLISARCVVKLCELIRWAWFISNRRHHLVPQAHFYCVICVVLSSTQFAHPASRPPLRLPQTDNHTTMMII